MSNPWKLILPSLLLGVLVGGAGGAWAQRRAFSRVPNTERALRRLSSNLNLDESQQAAVKTVLEERKAKMGALREETLAKSRELKLMMREQIRKVLKPDQLAKFETLVSAADARHKEGKAP